MIIHVRIVGTSRSLQEGAKTIKMEVPAGSSVSEVMKFLQLAEWEIGFILVNNRCGSRETILQDLDYLTLIAPLAGG